MVQMETEHAFH